MTTTIKLNQTQHEALIWFATPVNQRPRCEFRGTTQCALKRRGLIETKWNGTYPTEAGRQWLHDNAPECSH